MFARGRPQVSPTDKNAPQKAKIKGLSQKLLEKQMAQPFAMQNWCFRCNKRKKPTNEAKMSMTKRGSVKSSFLRVIQFCGELV